MRSLGKEQISSRVEEYLALVELGGGCVREILESLSGRYPVLGKRLFAADGRLNRFVNIYLNDEDIRFLDNLDTSTSSGDEISIVPAIAGG